jgi:hypothetical protein
MRALLLTTLFCILALTALGCGDTAQKADPEKAAIEAKQIQELRDKERPRTKK